MIFSFCAFACRVKRHYAGEVFTGFLLGFYCFFTGFWWFVTSFWWF